MNPTWSSLTRRERDAYQATESVCDSIGVTTTGDMHMLQAVVPAGLSYVHTAQLLAQFHCQHFAHHNSHKETMMRRPSRFQ